MLKYFILAISTFFYTYAHALEANVTTGNNSPIHNCYANSTCKITYNMAERIGEKIAIRKLWLLPSFNSTKKLCDPWSKCTDFYETFNIFAEVENITSNPLLLTSSNLEIITKSKNVTLAGNGIGSYILSDYTTENVHPRDFYLNPGDVIVIGFPSGLKLSGFFDFFTDEIKNDLIFSDINPALDSYLFRINDLNNYIKKKYGKDTKIKIEIFEKNKIKLITTYIPLSAGGDIFSVNKHDNSSDNTNPYYFQYDALLGEVIYRLKYNERNSAIEGRQ